MPGDAPRKQWVLTASLIATLSVCPGAESQQGPEIRLVPQNEAERAPGFAPVAARLEAAIRARDANAILTMVSDDVRIVAGGDERGPAAFRLHLDLDNPSSPFWTSVEEILAGGSSLRWRV